MSRGDGAAAQVREQMKVTRTKACYAVAHLHKRTYCFKSKTLDNYNLTWQISFNRSQTAMSRELSK